MGLAVDLRAEDQLLIGHALAIREVVFLEECPSVELPVRRVENEVQELADRAKMAALGEQLLAPRHDLAGLEEATLELPACDIGLVLPSSTEQPLDGTLIQLIVAVEEHHPRGAGRANAEVSRPARDHPSCAASAWRSHAHRWDASSTATA